MDVNYFVEEASFFTQEDFEYNFAEVIQVFDKHKTHITTEDKKKLVINWDTDGYFQNYYVVYETDLMENTFNRTYVNDIINKLKTIEVDGETMQYILEQVGMDMQMLRQLMLTMPIEQVEYLIEERKNLKI